MRNRYQLYQQTKDSPQEEHTLSGAQAAEAGADAEAETAGGDSSFVAGNSRSEGLSGEGSNSTGSKGSTKQRQQPHRQQLLEEERAGVGELRASDLDDEG